MKTALAQDVIWQVLTALPKERRAAFADDLLRFSAAAVAHERSAVIACEQLYRLADGLAVLKDSPCS